MYVSVLLVGKHDVIFLAVQLSSAYHYHDCESIEKVATS